MIKKELLRMRRLRATPKMVQIAQKDIPQKVTVGTGAYSYQDIRQKYQLFLRCRIEDDVLKVALYYPDNLRAEGRLPTYEVFIDRSAQRFITYDCINSKWLNAKLDRLDWPRSMPMYPSTWMSDADAKAAANYLGSEYLGYKAILKYQLQLREEALVRRHRKETDPWDADMALMPALPKDWNRWVDKVGIPQNFIFYQYEKRGAKTGYCTYCGKDISLRVKPHHNKPGRCPCCRHEITYKAVGRLGWHLDTEEVCVHLIQGRPDGFVVREFWASRRYVKKDYRNPTVSCVEHWRVIYDHDMAARTYYWGNYKQLCTRWIAGEPSYSWMGYNSIYCYHGCKEGRVYGKTLPHLAKGTLKRTGLADWIYEHGFVANPNKYMGLYMKIPQFEQIWKANLPKLTEECWSNYRCMDGLIKKPQSSNLTKALGIDKQELARLRQHNGGCFLLQWLQWEKQSGKSISDEVLQWFHTHKVSADQLDFIWDKMTPVQVYHYLQRQSDSSHEPIRQVITTWQDYLAMAVRFHLDVNNEIVFRTSKLRQRHDELVLRCKQIDKQVQAADVLKKFPEVDHVCQSIKAKYEYANEEYAIIAPAGALDIIVEGDMLGHCLRGSDRYWDRIETHESYIMFLRRTSALNTPYYTLEIEPGGTVRQLRTYGDDQNDDIQEARGFLREWQAVVAKRITEEDRRAAAASRVLREKEFEQMRRDNIIIFTGNLAGQRMVDVLTADLMEAAA